jgi:hypothetical protein
VLKLGYFKKYSRQLGNFKMWCWKRMKIIWANQVENEEALHRVKEKKIIVQSYRQLNKGRLTKLVTPCIGSTLLKHVEGKHRCKDRRDRKTRKKT